MAKALSSRKESRFTSPRPDCPFPERWHSFDSDATEDEVSEFIYGMIRAIQPDICLETGTHLGHTSKFIGKALKKNGQGILHTYEPNASKVEKAKAYCVGLPIQFHAAESMTQWSGEQIDFAWFDSLVPLRSKEFEFYYPYMTNRTIVGFHDAGLHHGPWSNTLRTSSKLKVIDLPTPRGCLVGMVIK